MKRTGLALFAVVLATGSLAGQALAQSARPLAVSLSTDTVQMGELFELRVSVPVPPGSTVYFPDTLPATVFMESAAQVRSAAQSSAEGGATLTLTYPMIAFGAGTLPVPGLDVLVTQGAEGTGDVLPGGSRSGAWADAPLRTASVLTRIPRQAVWVVPVFTPQDLVQGIEPRPANDVVGGNWNWPSLALVLLFSSVLAATLVSTTREWLTGSRPAGVPHEDPSLEALRQRALSELDTLRAGGLPAAGYQLDFYARSSGIVRTYVEAMDREWAPSLTSTELVSQLRARSGDAAAGDLPVELGTAEVVKFGLLRPESDAAERHWQALRAWVVESGGRAW